MAGNAAARYTEMVEATVEQRARLLHEAASSQRWDRIAPVFRFDPRRPLEPNLEVLASYVGDADTLIDVGGGAGRVGLPLALRCASLTNVEPSAGMAKEFLASAAEAGVSNVRLLQTAWPAREELNADIVISTDVAYFIADIVPFIAALQSAARRSVILWIWSVPPPNRHAVPFAVVHREPKAPVPGHRELLPVLWDMDILPEIKVLPEPFTWPEALPRSHDAAVKFALDAVEASATRSSTARVEEAFPRLFRMVDDVYQPTWRPPAKGLLITWETTS